MRPLRFLAALALLALAAPALQSQGRPMPYMLAETGQRYGSLAEAAAAIGNGAGTIVVDPGLWRDCLVQTQGVLTLRAASPGKAVFDGGVCEGKATLVLRGRGATVDGIIFQNIYVPDGNGAGIRLESGDLTVTNTFFRDSEEGILSGDDAEGTIRIDHSSFAGLGRCDRGLSCAHSLYIGHYGTLIVTRSRFERGRGGHYVKSRAARAIITDNSFDDSAGSATNYMIDLPGGASGEIARNLFVQGENKENWTAFIAVAAEGRERSSAGLSVHDNDARLAPGVVRSTWFVADWGGDQPPQSGNTLGRGLTAYQRR